MGKSTTLGFFRDAGIPVYSADDTVHELYAGRAATMIEAAFPGTVVNGIVDRAALSAQVVGNESAMKHLEAIIHPLVHDEEANFAAKAAHSGATLAIFDIPLLYETGRQEDFDAVIVVTAPADVQRQRVLGRPAMTPQKFEAILARQLPDAEKRKRADYIIDTSNGLEPARTAVAHIISGLTVDSSGRAN